MLDSFTINLDDLNLITVIFRTFLSILIGGIIGTERDIRNRAAGVRTHMLVCLGAAIIMMTNEYIYFEFGDAGIDVTRMSAQVVSGIGFIGAGTILVTSDNRIKGLTTAAGLWAAAAIGLAIGIGFYEIALIGGVAIISIMILLKPFKKFIHMHSNQPQITLVIRSTDGFKSFLEYTASTEVTIIDIQVENKLAESPDHNNLTFTAILELGEQLTLEDVIENLENTEGISSVNQIKK